MGKLLILISGRIVVTLRMKMKTVPTSCRQVSGFTRFFICFLYIQQLQDKIWNVTKLSKTILFMSDICMSSWVDLLMFRNF